MWLKFFATVQIEKKNWRYRQSDRTPDVNCTNVNSVGISTKSNKKFTLPSSYRLLYSFHRETVALRTYLPPPPSPLLGRRELVECSIYEKNEEKKEKGKKIGSENSFTRQIWRVSKVRRRSKLNRVINESKRPIGWKGREGE